MKNTIASDLINTLFPSMSYKYKIERFNIY